MTKVGTGVIKEITQAGWHKGLAIYKSLYYHDLKCLILLNGNPPIVDIKTDLKNI